MASLTLPACLPVCCLLPAEVTDLHTMQAFDGPVPETLNGRLCMLAIPIALFEEWQTHNGMWQQVFAHPERIIGITLLITLATYTPILR